MKPVLADVLRDQHRQDRGRFYGVQGERPVASRVARLARTEFVRTGWDVKAMQKLIVMSATYRQIVQGYTRAVAARSGETGCSRAGPRLRLALGDGARPGACGVRIASLKKIGGPSVKPYQPAGLWKKK